jgi:hypothetical protein
MMTTIIVVFSCRTIGTKEALMDKYHHIEVLLPPPTTTLQRPTSLPPPASTVMMMIIGSSDDDDDDDDDVHQICCVRSCTTGIFCTVDPSTTTKIDSTINTYL